MMQQIFRQIIAGLAWGAIITFIALTILVATNTESSVTTVWLYMGASLFLGIYFGLASFIFTMEQWNPLKKTIVHFILSLTVYFVVAMPLGWVPINPLAISLSTISFIFVYILFWIGFSMYYRKEAASLNDTLEKKDQ